MDKKIKWAERLPRNLIRRLYESDAKHIQDNELADEVGYGLYARAKDLIEINKTHGSGMIYCKSCKKEIYKSAGEIYKCICGWFISIRFFDLAYKPYPTSSANSLSCICFASLSYNLRIKFRGNLSAHFIFFSIFNPFRF